ncbi:Nif3-like dinuclear metal center hexameric protein [Streptococcus equi subsp. zooepidemicus]|uniref:GTP cyclohydrolase 1 type 2 homolog n=1 Tax=Streptococcus equi subsp. zooepidemicus TaxID=40041 RepID=A0AAX2LIA6_STRSZ|nr:Nif3-like dinuclear metal center hexameric protein [Streptococcus equi]KIS10792.1 NIF3 (NGG1p interacting factor 3) family protein [Streptococcus equi subsp. zooepidemicus Sz57]MCD3396388.1 Nif3-like dinuclear metal center hexameric protein [Streptococcus equi subsp. zooepidemicus]MCD3427980.1 Nif3-like dinuclear metal center hexameric protein [Streptococcus equi subsp. zooepidemicus]MCD3433526.1 Nif3-like dinuclear metal center hexameric protein [Streptococcus equi subsp. zooepidemicus]QTC
MKARTIIEKYESYCPLELSMSGDVCGLQIGSLDKEVKRVMITLDVRENTVAEAIAAKVDLIITKHAPIFKGLKDLVSSPQRDIVLELVKHDISVYVSHTNIDIVSDGLNDWFCELLGIDQTEALVETQDGYGIGRVGNVAEQTLEELGLVVKEAFGLDVVRLVRYTGQNPLISRVAICGGSGDKFYQAALAKGAQVYITGDIYYHTAQEMLTEGLLAIDPGHHIESLFIDQLVAKMQTWKKEEGWQVTIMASNASTNPFSHL